MVTKRDDMNPYVGPRPFEREDNNLFFGRDYEAKKLTSLVIAHQAVLLYAQSGAGKTSLLNAKVLPLLEAKGHRVNSPARVQGNISKENLPDEVSPSKISNIFIFNALLNWASKESEWKTLLNMSLVKYLQQKTQSFEKTDESQHPHFTIIIFDQFEELFLFYPDRWRDREDFFRQVSTALEKDKLLRVAFAMKEEYIANLDPYRKFLPERLQTQVHLERLRENTALIAIEEPAKVGKRKFTKAASKSLVKDLLKIESQTAVSQEKSEPVIGEFIEPVHLQVVCRKLWAEIKEKEKTITLEHLQEYGDIDLALMDFYEQAIRVTQIETGVEERVIRWWFDNKLITPDDVRASIKEGETKTGELPNSAVKELERQHIIRPQPHGESTWYELSHDRFIPPIKKSNEEWEKSLSEYLKPTAGKQVGHEINEYKDSVIERLIVRGERAEELELYFGEELFSEIRQLAQETSTKSSDEGPRVLIIPEFMSSKLGKEGRIFDDIIWLDPIDISRGNLSELSLNQSDKHFKAMGVFLYAYLKLKLILASDGYNVDFFPYDWRDGIIKSGGILAKRIHKEDHDTIHLVCHGMGGLVARAAAIQNPQKIGYIVMLGCPNYGSYMPIQLLRSVYPIVQRLASVDKTNSPESMVEKVFSNFPSLYDMLPIASKSGGLDFFSNENWPSIGWRPPQSYLDAAELTHNSLAMANERFFSIAGVNQETVTGIEIKDKEFVYQYSIAGDGTVPLSLAELDNCTTFFIEESHGSLPNNRSVAKAISEILAKGSTDLLLKSWTLPPARVIKEVVESEIKQAWYDPVIRKSISFREQRQLLDELVSSRSRDFAQPTRHDSAAILEFRHRLDLSLAFGSITDVKAQIYVVGLYDGVSPSGPANTIDSVLGGAIENLVLRRQITLKTGQIQIMPTGMHTRLTDFICFVGLGPYDAINEKVIETITGNLISALIRLRIDDFATVIFGGSSGLNISRTIESFLKGLFRSIWHSKSDHRLQSFTICEINRDRYESIKREIYAFSDRQESEQIYLNIKEKRLSPIISLNLKSYHRKEKREPVYLTVRCHQAEMSLNFVSTVLTSGQNAVIVQGRQQVRWSVLQKHLEKILSHSFTYSRLPAFGQELNELVLHPDVVSNLKHFSEDHLVIIHDRLSSLIPWETINIGSSFPAATGGLSRRYLADNLSVAKWLEHRKYGPRLDVLLVVNPTGDLPGAADEGRRIQELFGGYTSAVNLKVLEESQARKKILLELLSSGEYDVVHYAGHAYFDPQNPSSSGILCHDLKVLSGTDLAGIGNLPTLMFFNACEVARVRKARDASHPELAMTKRIQRNVGLAEAFMQGGVANCMGTYWPVGDAPAKRFAEVFYSYIMQGNDIGRSLLEARKELQANHWIDWAAYVLCGNPKFVLKMPAI